MLVICPTFVASTLAFGMPRLVWLNTLRESVRNVNDQRSVNLNVLNAERSCWMKCGP